MNSTTSQAKQAFDFVDGGRTYACHVEAMRGRGDWWWFDVSGDSARYAPFRTADDDTPESVAPRVLAYYEDRLARRGGAPWQDRGPAAAPLADAPPAPSTDVTLADAVRADARAADALVADALRAAAPPADQLAERPAA